MLKVIFYKNTRLDVNVFVKIARDYADDVNQGDKRDYIKKIDVVDYVGCDPRDEVFKRKSMGDKTLFVVCYKHIEGNGVELATLLRKANPDAYIAFIADNAELDLCRTLANSNTRLSGFLFYNEPQAFRGVLKNVWEEYAAEQRRDGRYITARVNGKSFAYDMNNVMYLTSINGKIRIELWDGKRKESHEFYAVLRDLWREHEDRFLRCHNAYLVNKDKIKGHNYKEIILANDEPIPVSDTYSRAVKRYFEMNKDKV